MSQKTYLGTYRLIKKLGSGGTSVVYLAYDPFGAREVAIKVISTGDVKKEADSLRQTD